MPNIASSPAKVSFTAFLDAVARVAKAQGAAFAAWRNPESNRKQMIVSISGRNYSNNLSKHINGRPGFLFSPFRSIEGEASSEFILADSILEETEEGYSLRWGEDVDKEKIMAFEDALLGAILEITDSNSSYQWSTDSTPEPEMEESGLEREQFIQLVRSGIDCMKRGAFTKFVAARRMKVKLPESFSSAKTFEKLSELYEQCFISCVSLPGQPIWVGASPESLICIKRDGHAVTVALAGTKRRGSCANPECLSSWGRKEIEEHEYVCQFIENTLREFGVSSFEKSDRHPHKSGHLHHLRCCYRFSIVAPGCRKIDFEALIYALHPTSAICGLPKRNALNFILQEESFSRSYYCGFLGPVNFEDTVNLFVNIRCMNIRNRSAVLYAGAGITCDSNPDDEWDETTSKLGIVAAALKP
jgi:isochorismate synthase